MKLNDQQLADRLKQQLDPIYLIYGPEVLTVQESTELVKHAARVQGFDEHRRFQIDAKFNWSELESALTEQSLFSNKTFIDAELTNGKIGRHGGEALQKILKSIKSDHCLLLWSTALEHSAQSTAWFRELSKQVVVTHWAVNSNQLPQWIRQRARRFKLSLTSEAVTCLAERTEGNLLACSQELEKLSLIFGEQPLTARHIKQAVYHHAQYDIYLLVDTALSGHAQRAYQIFLKLKDMGQEPILMLWVVTKEVRALVNMLHDQSQGESISTLLERYRVWNKRKPIITAALKRLGIEDVMHCHHQCLMLDKIIKGAESGDIWSSMGLLILSLAGVKTVREENAC